MKKNGVVEVIVFDLNGTFYNKSSKDEFFKFILSKQPSRIKYYFQMLYYKLLKKLHRINHTEFKENFFNYLNGIPPAQTEAYAKEFWEQEYPENFNKDLIRHFSKMRQQGVKLYCATGSLEIYAKPFFTLYEVDGYAGTKVKYQDGTYIVQGKACKDEEKLKRLAQHFQGQPFTIIEAYSDSKEAILDAAQKSYLLINGELTTYSGD